MHCTITQLTVYPVKACRGTNLHSAPVSASGLAGDRQLLVVADGAMLNQKRAPQLATVVPVPTAADELQLQAPAAGTITHRVVRDGPPLTVNYYMDQLQLVDQGDALAGWFGAVLGREVRVVALPAPYRRHIPLDEFAAISGDEQAGFPDVAPLLMTNTASLDDLNARLDQSVPMDRFRPNVVIEGLPAYAEDDIGALAGEAGRLLRITRCERCAVTATDQVTGERCREPLATLKSYRKQGDGYAGGIVFGAYMTFAGDGELHVGDRFEPAG